MIAVVNSLCRYAATYLRMILSATFGAMGAVIVCLVPQEYKFAANIVTYICIGMGMVRICAGNVAFAELIKGFFALYAAAFMLGGVMHVLYYYTYAGYIIRQVIVRDRELMVFLGVSFGFLLLLYRQLVRIKVYSEELSEIWEGIYEE